MSSLQSCHRAMVHIANTWPACRQDAPMKLPLRKTQPSPTSLDHSWSHTRRIIIICRTWEFIKLFVIFTKSSEFFFSAIYPSGFQSLATSNPLLFRRVSSLPLLLKRNHVGWGSVWSLSLKRTFCLFLSPRYSRGLEGGRWGWGHEGRYICSCSYTLQSSLIGQSTAATDGQVYKYLLAICRQLIHINDPPPNNPTAYHLRFMPFSRVCVQKCI